MANSKLYKDVECMEAIYRIQISSPSQSCCCWNVLDIALGCMFLPYEKIFNQRAGYSNIWWIKGIVYMQGYIHKYRIENGIQDA